MSLRAEVRRWVAVVWTAIAVSQGGDALQAQTPPRGVSRNVIVVVTDGLRWQEVFGGADSTILFGQPKAAGDTASVRREFWRPTADERRRALMPFLWSTVATRGLLLGDRARGSSVQVTNGVNVSYPGYNEMLTGRADPRIRNNGFGPNPNRTVFDWIAGRPGFAGKVAAYGTWSTFDDIFNRQRAAFPVHAGWSVPYAKPTSTLDSLLNRMYATSHREWHDVAWDALMQSVVVRAMRDDQPRLLFVGFGETDEWAHAGRYDNVLRSAHAVDGFIAELWMLLQTLPAYRDSTTLLVTTDHGRGYRGEAWREHGSDIAGAEDIWLGMIGPGAPPRGAATGRFTQAQIAATIAWLLGEDFAGAVKEVSPPIIPR